MPKLHFLRLVSQNPESVCAFMLLAHRPNRGRLNTGINKTWPGGSCIIRLSIGPEYNFPSQDLDALKQNPPCLL